MMSVKYQTLVFKLTDRMLISDVIRCRISVSSLVYTMHYGDVIMIAMVSQINSLPIVYSTVYWGADQRKHQSSVSLAPGPVNSTHKGPVTRKMFPFDDVIMGLSPVRRQTISLTGANLLPTGPLRTDCERKWKYETFLSTKMKLKYHLQRGRPDC